jgi:hypothetical protein
LAVRHYTRDDESGSIGQFLGATTTTGTRLPVVVRTPLSSGHGGRMDDGPPVAQRHRPPARVRQLPCRAPPGPGRRPMSALPPCPFSACPGSSRPARRGTPILDRSADLRLSSSGAGHGKTHQAHRCGRAGRTRLPGIPPPREAAWWVPATTRRAQSHAATTPLRGVMPFGELASWPCPSRLTPPWPGSGSHRREGRGRQG